MASGMDYGGEKKDRVKKHRNLTYGFWPGLDFATYGFWPGLDFAVCSFSKRVATRGFWLGFGFAVCSLSKCVETIRDGCVWVAGWHYGIMFGYEKWNMEVVCVCIYSVSKMLRNTRHHACIRALF